MSCSSPFTLDVSVIETTVITAIDYQCSGSCTIPALSIPSSETCDSWVTKGGAECTWVKATYTEKKVCSKVWTKWCWTCKKLDKCAYSSCEWVKVDTNCNGWLDWPEVEVFPEITIPMTANIPFVISSGVNLEVSDVGVTPVAILSYAIYESYVVNGVTETFKLNMNFGGGIDFDFYLPKGEVVTITDCNGSFSATVLLYNFGTFTYPDPITGFTYTMSMTTNLLFCLASAEWLKLQVCTNTTITGWGIKPIVLPINYAIPLVE